MRLSLPPTKPASFLAEVYRGLKVRLRADSTHTICIRPGFLTLNGQTRKSPEASTPEVIFSDRGCGRTSGTEAGRECWLIPRVRCFSASEIRNVGAPFQAVTLPWTVKHVPIRSGSDWQVWDGGSTILPTRVASPATAACKAAAGESSIAYRRISDRQFGRLRGDITDGRARITSLLSALKP